MVAHHPDCHRESHAHVKLWRQDKSSLCEESRMSGQVAQPSLVAGRYQIINALNSGGMSTVYRSFDQQEQRDVAVKLISGENEPDDRVRQTAFEREMQALTRLKHENIVTLLDWGTDGDDWYVVLPLLAKDMQAWLDEKRPEGPMGWDDFARILGLPIAKGLAFAHERDVLHRDIKPSNILLDRSGPKLADFGIAKIKDDIRSPAMTFVDAGTRPFRPREDDDGSHTYSRDVHALGVLFLVALSALDPYSEKYRSRPYDFLQDALEEADIPAEIDELIRQSVSEDPHDRPENASVFLRRLEQVQHLRERAWATRRTFHLGLTNNGRTKAMHALGASELQVEQAITDDLASDARISIFRDPKTGEMKACEYRLYGIEGSYHVALDEYEGRGSFVVISAIKPGGSQIDAWREKAFDPNANFEFGAPANRTEAQNAVGQLDQALLEFENDREAAAASAGERQAFQDWRAVLRALEDVERRREHPLRYTKVSRGRGATIVFELDTEVEESEVLDQPRTIPLDGGGFFRGVVASVNGNRLTLAASPGRNPDRIPPKGELRVDTWPAITAIRRQSAALDAVEYEHAVRPGLRSLLADPSTVAPPLAIGEMQFFNEKLDASKQHAVRAALGSEDFLVVEGPPGTGKTTFITELIEQELRRKPDLRILVASQTHAALDNVVERLARRADTLRMVRIARDDDPRVSEIATAFLLETQVHRWRDELIKASREYLRSWVKDVGLDLRSVENATWLEEIAALRERDAEGADRLADIEAELEAKPSDLVPGTSRHDHFSKIEGDRAFLKDGLEDGKTERREIALRLQKTKALPKLTDAETLTVDELRRLASSQIATESPHLDKCMRLVRLLADWHIAFGRGDEFAVAALERANVVAATCLGIQQVTGADKIEFDLCIVDEASKATATESLVPIVQSKRWVLVGDRKQLPPFFDNELSKPEVRDKYQLTEGSRTTLFSRLADMMSADSVLLLSEQHRMHPAIGNLISHCFYDNKLTSSPRPPLEGLQHVVEAPVTWRSTSKLSDPGERRVGRSFQNTSEARIIKNLCERFAWLAEQKGFDEPLEIALLTGYSAQRDLLERQIAEVSTRYAGIASFECSSVDAFQGRECDIALYSVTRSNPKGQVGFLSEVSRLNVALSRPRHALVVVGDHSFIRRAQGSTRALVDVLDYIESHDPECRLVVEESA